MSRGLRSAIAFVTTVVVTSCCALFLLEQGLGWVVFAALLGAFVYSVLSMSLAAEDAAGARPAGGSAGEGARETVQP